MTGVLTANHLRSQESKMTSAQLVEKSVNNNNPSYDFTNTAIRFHQVKSALKFLLTKFFTSHNNDKVINLSAMILILGVLITCGKMTEEGTAWIPVTLLSAK